MHTNPEISPFSESPKESKPEKDHQPVCILNTVELADASITSTVLSNTEVKGIIFGERPQLISEGDLQTLAEIEEQAFGSYISEEWLSSEEDFQEEFANLQGPQFLIRENGKLVGFLHSKPSSQAYQNFKEVGLLEQDPNFQPTPKTLYIEAIAGNFGRIGPKVWRTLEQQARSLGFKKIICHGLNPKLNRILIMKLGFRVVRKIDNWLGHQAEVLEKEIQP